MTLLNKKHLLSLCRCTNIPVDLLETVRSTNDYLKEATGTHRHFCIANHQTHGRGQRARHWHSPASENIYFSYRHPFNRSLAALSGLSLAVSVTLCTLLKAWLPDTPLQIKWPNDIVYNNQKLAGILVELKPIAKEIHAIIGIGINVNMMPDTASMPIDQPWTSIKQITHNEFDRHLLCASLIDHLPHSMDDFQNQGLSPFLEQWRTTDALLGKRVRIQQYASTFEGIAQGVDAQGHLIVATTDAGRMTFVSGEASIIK